MPIISKKICLVCDFGVGKTSLIRRFVERQFSDQYLSTVGVKIFRKNLELLGVKQQEKLNLQLLIWDLEGHTKFKAIAPTYLQGASGALIVADVTRQETLELMPPFHGERMRSYGQLICDITEKVMNLTPGKFFSARSVMQDISLQVIL